MPRHQPLDRSQALIGAFHYVMAGTAVNVNVDQPWSQHRVAEVQHPRAGRNAHVGPEANGSDDAIFHHYYCVVDRFQRSEQLPCQQNRCQIGAFRVAGKTALLEIAERVYGLRGEMPNSSPPTTSRSL